MDNKRIILILLIVVIGVTIVSCKGKGGFKRLFSKEDEIEIIRSDEGFEFEITEDDEGMRKTVFYFRDKQGLLVPLMMKIPWEEGIARLTLRNMIDSPELRENIGRIGLFPIIPTGTQIIGMAINEETGLCKIDFSKEVLNYETKEDEENLIRGVVYTLTEFDSIDEVQFMVDGNVLSNLKHGSNVSAPIKRENINLAGSLEDQRSKVVVYYKGNNFEEDYEYFVPVTIPTLAPVPNVYTALEALFDGAPTGFSLGSGIPIGTSFHGVDIRDGIAYVDISFEDDALPTDSRIYDNISKNIGLTLSEFEQISRVELLIDGKDMFEIGLEFDINNTIPAFANEY